MQVQKRLFTVLGLAAFSRNKGFDFSVQCVFSAVYSKAGDGISWKTFRHHLYCYSYFDAKNINCVLRTELVKQENFLERICCLAENSPL